MERCYRNNPRSLFRKYSALVTWYGRQRNPNIVLYLPNGHIEQSEGSFRMVVSTRPVNAPRLLPILQAIDAINYRLESFAEAQKVLAWYLEGGRMPKVLRSLCLAQSTFNPDANPETTSVDGRVGRSAGLESWSVKRDSAGDSSTDSATSTDAPQLIASSSAGTPWSELFRLITLYDTSALPNDAIVASTSKARLFISSTTTTLGSQSYRLVTCTPASTTALVNADYNVANWSAVAQGSDATLAGITTSAYNDITLNSAGRASVSLSGITKFGYRLVSDADNSEPSWSSSVIARITANHADNGSNKPTLTIDYLTGGANTILATL